MPETEVLVIGAGIVGAACALELARSGRHVTVVDPGFPGNGATSECMGHLVVMDDSEAQFALTAFSRDLWEAERPHLPTSAEHERRGTLWVAADAEEMGAVEAKHACYRERGVATEIVGLEKLYELEPNLRPGLNGGLRVPDDGVIYAPGAASYFIRAAEATGRCRFLQGVRVVEIHEGSVRLQGGEASELKVEQIVVAGGIGTTRLLPEIPIRPRKGMLAITDRYPDFARHQIVELGYLKSAHGSEEDSVAFNIQPRFTGQMLIGSSRQFHQEGRAIDFPLLRRMLRRAMDYMPGLKSLRVTRTWAGFRPCGPDHLPLIGPCPGRPGVWLATGHEGLGITTAPGTAHLLAALMNGSAPKIDPAPYLPERLVQARPAHG